jgi:hypothetical protein
LNVSEQQAEQISGEPGSLSAGQAAHNTSDTQDAAAASAQEPTSIDSPALVPEQGAASEADAGKTEAPEPETLKAEAPNAEACKPETRKTDAPRSTGRVMIMSAGDRGWANDGDAGPKLESERASGMLGKRRLAALAAVVTLAMVAGVLGGALATAGLSHLVGGDAASAGDRPLEAAVARLDADISNLKVSLEHTSRMGMAQFNKTNDRLDRFEKALAEPSAKLVKLSEAVERLRAVPAAAAPVAAVPVAAKQATGSIPSPVPTPREAPRIEVGRLPTVDGWVLHQVANGGALIEGRRAIYEVYAGDPVPGLGRVDAIRKQDGRWVVVTSKGLIVAR